MPHGCPDRMVCEVVRCRKVGLMSGSLMVDAPCFYGNGVVGVWFVSLGLVQVWVLIGW